MPSDGMIGTPVAAIGFCTIEDVEEFLQVTITGDAAKVASCNRAIVEATEAIRNYCKQYLSLVEDDEYIFDVGKLRWNLLLPELPVVEVSTVVEDGETLVEGDDEDYMVALHGQLVRRGGRWAIGPQIVTVTYTHGYSTIPQDIVDVCTSAAARRYQAGLQSAETKGVPGVASKSLGDYSVSFGTGGGGEGILGASGARFLLLSEKDILNRYRQNLP